MLCVNAALMRRNCLCTTCFKNEQTLTLIESNNLTTTRFLLMCQNLHILFVSDLQFALSLYLQSLIILLVYTNQATQEVQPFNDLINSALHDSEPLCYCD